jgi:hypothetical protein
MLVVSHGIFHGRRRKIMALISLKPWTGIAAVTIAGRWRGRQRQKAA